MHELPDLSRLSIAEKDALILAQFAQLKQVARLTAMVKAELVPPSCTPPNRRRRWFVIYGGYAAFDSSPPAIMIVVQPDKMIVAPQVPSVMQIAAAVIASPVVHFDETRQRVGARLHWLHSVGTPLLN